MRRFSRVVDQPGGRDLRRPAGSVLLTVLAAVVVAAILGYALMRLAVRSTRTGAWSRDHVVLRLLAESAVEESFVRLEQGANRPGQPAFRALRMLRAGGPDRPLTVPGMAPDLLAEDVKARQALFGGPVTLETSAKARKLIALSEDPMERAGLIRVECTARLRRGTAQATERFRADRAFRIVRITPGPPLNSASLLVALPGKGGLANLPANRPAFAAGTGPPRTLLDFLTRPAPEGLRPAARTQMKALTRAMAALTPEALGARAQYVTRSGAELARFVADRLGTGRPLNGTIHNLSFETLRLAFPSFRGKCLISTMGSLVVGDIALEDRTRDILTLVAGQRLSVDGRSVQANLVQLSDLREGILFQQPAKVFGALYTTLWPAGLGLDSGALGACQVEFNPALASVRGRSGPAGEREAAAYIVAFAPYPASIEHARESEGWSAW